MRLACSPSLSRTPPHQTSSLLCLLSLSRRPLHSHSFRPPSLPPLPFSSPTRTARDCGKHSDTLRRGRERERTARSLPFCHRCDPPSHLTFELPPSRACRPQLRYHPPHPPASPPLPIRTTLEIPVFPFLVTSSNSRAQAARRLHCWALDQPPTAEAARTKNQVVDSPPATLCHDDRPDRSRRSAIETASPRLQRY